MKKIEEIKTRVYKLLLYADNSQQMRVLRRIRRLYPDNYIGIWHIQRDDKGHELIKGQGKKHAHVILNLDNPVYWRSLCRKIGLLTAEGEPDYRFCWALGYRYTDHLEQRSETLKGAYVYLTHTNAPLKEQYDAARLFGAPDLIKDAAAAILAYQMRNMTMSQAVVMALQWIDAQEGKVVKMSAFGYWICSTPYFKAASSPVVRAAIQEHNQVVYDQKWRQMQRDRYGDEVEPPPIQVHSKDDFSEADFAELSEDEATVYGLFGVV